MLSARAAAKIIASYDKISFFYFFDKIFIQIFHCMLCQFLFLVCSKVSSWNYFICVNVRSSVNMCFAVHFQLFLINIFLFLLVRQNALHFGVVDRGFSLREKPNLLFILLL